MQWLIDNGATLVVGVITIWFVYKQADNLKNDFYRIHHSINEKIEHLSQLFGQLVSWMNGTQKRPFEFFHSINPNRTEGTALKTAAPGSPVSLTQKGVDIANAIRAQELVDKYMDKVRPFVPESANRLVIQDIVFEFCQNKLLQLVSKKERDVIEEAIFEGGDGRDAILIIYAVLMRNAFFAELKLKVPPIPIKDK